MADRPHLPGSFQKAAGLEVGVDGFNQKHDAIVRSSKRSSANRGRSASGTWAMPSRTDSRWRKCTSSRASILGFSRRSGDRRPEWTSTTSGSLSWMRRRCACQAQGIFRQEGLRTFSMRPKRRFGPRGIASESARSTSASIPARRVRDADRVHVSTYEKTNARPLPTQGKR